MKKIESLQGRHRLHTPSFGLVQRDRQALNHRTTRPAEHTNSKIDPIAISKLLYSPRAGTGAQLAGENRAPAVLGHAPGVSEVLPADPLAAFALRLFFYIRFPHVTGDSLIYGDIARNWLQHGIYGLSHAEGPRPTWIRLPGYPAFLAACFALFGTEHYHAVLLVQIVIDVAGCFVIADLARRTVSDGRGASRFSWLRCVPLPPTTRWLLWPRP